MKKFRCTVCGYVYEGDAAPEKCPLCKAPASKFVEVVEVEGGALTFADEHVIGVAKGCDEEMIKELNMPLNLLNCWVTVFGIPKQTCRNVKMLNKVHAKTKNVSQLVQKL